MKIRSKVLLFTLVAIVVSVTTALLIGRTIALDIVKQQISGHLATAVQSRASHVETFLKAEIEAIKQLSASIVFERFLSSSVGSENYDQVRDDAMRRLRETAAIGNYTHSLFILDRDGTIVASSVNTDIGKDKSEDPYFLRGQEDPFIKDAYVSRDRGIHALAFSAPILDEEQAFLGVVVARVSMQEINTVMTDKTGLAETGEIYLVNRDGYMITPSRFIENTFLRQEVDLKSDHDTEQGIEHQTIGIAENYMDSSVLRVHEHILSMEWCVIGEVGTEEAFALIAKLTRVLLLVLAGILAVGLVASIGVSGTIARPIVALHHGTEEIEKGNLDYKVGTSAKDEIGQLSRAFDKMTGELKRSQGELEEYSRELERKVQERTADLEQSNEELKRFAYIVSHDLRAPLVNLKGFSAELRSALEILRSVMGKALLHLDEEERRSASLAIEEDIPEALEFIDSSVTRMDGFINAVLKLSRVGRRELNFEPIDMNDLVQSTLNTLAHQIKKRQVRVAVELLPEVIADRTSMEQIMGNLLNNAIVYLDPNRPGEIVVSGEKGERAITFHVRDNGRGIAEGDMDKVFAPFRRAGRQDVSGEGMGLSYVQTLVRRHGGHIRCTSELGVRTTFSFSIAVKT